jgi:hypothetical protein
MEVDQYNNTFCTRNGQFEYRVMSLRLTNAAATFQAYMQECLRPVINDYAVYYIHSLMMFSTTEEEHKEQIQAVL